MPNNNHGVRKYEPETGRFTAPDPLWSKYYGWTPYQYSLNSPLMLVDVGGEDVVEIEYGTGNVCTYISNENVDEFHIVDVHGDRIPGSSITFASGTITEFDDQPFEKNDKLISQTRFTINGDDNATKLFEFLSDPWNTKVEWGLGRIGSANSGINMIGTNHNKENNPFGGWLFSNQYETVKEYWHNHPSGYPDFSRQDIKSIDYLQKFNPTTIFGVFVWPSIYVEY